MIIIILQKVPPSLRGELSHWFIEPHTGVFIGHVSALVRDKLWEKCCQQKSAGSVIQAWSTNNEQHFEIRTNGHTSRTLLDLDGIQLPLIPHKTGRKKKSEVSSKYQSQEPS